MPQHHHHHDPNIHSQSQTYEQKTANTTLEQSPDPIHWNPNYAFRSQPYRHLQHQNNTIGIFHVRLVEARDLKRSHWSLLGMGMVKHLGLSNAHGEVSSFCNLRLGYRFRKNNTRYSLGRNNSTNIPVDYNVDQHGRGKNTHQFNQYNWQNANLANTIATSNSAPNTNIDSSSHHPNNNSTNSNNNNIIFTNHNIFRSSTISSNSNPKWPSVQTNTNKSSFDIPLIKGSMPNDGMEIILSIQMKEEKSAVDSFVPIGTGGGINESHENSGRKSNDNAFLLGCGQINLTGLVMQGLTTTTTNTTTTTTTTTESHGIVDVYDEWIPLTNQNGNKDEENNDINSYGQVRLLISYEPNGMQPQKNDIIAFESFARNSNLLSHCPIVIPPLHPLKVKDVKGEYILAEFDLSPVLGMINTNNITTTAAAANTCNYYNFEHDENAYHTTKRKHGFIRLHRNSIFVIERTNIVDSAIDISLKPTDILLSTELGQNVSNAAQPYVEAAGDLLAPVLLSSKLLLEAGKVGGGALAIGLKSAVVSVVENSDPERRRKVKRSSTNASAAVYHEQYHH